MKEAGRQCKGACGMPAGVVWRKSDGRPRGRWLLGRTSLARAHGTSLSKCQGLPGKACLAATPRTCVLQARL